MNAIVIYRSKYGSTKAYAEWIAEELGCSAVESKTANISDLEKYDTIIYGGGLYAEVINGVHLITKNLAKLEGKKLIVFSTGITPLDCREYYDKLVVEKNFKPEMLDKIKVYNFLGKMVNSELSLVHRAALKTFKKSCRARKIPLRWKSSLLSFAMLTATSATEAQSRTL